MSHQNKAKQAVSSVGKFVGIIGLIAGIMLLMLFIAYFIWGFFSVGSFSMGRGTVEMYPLGNCVYIENNEKYNANYAPADYNPFINKGQYMITIPERNIKITVTRNGESFKILSQEGI